MAKKPKGRRPHRRIPMSPEAQAAFEQQLECFREKFGRDPRGNEPVFFDPDFDVPTPFDPNKMRAQTLIAFLRAGAPEHLIYGFVRTDGMIFTEDTVHLWPQDDLDLWQTAMEEFERHFGSIDEDYD